MQEYNVAFVGICGSDVQKIQTDPDLPLTKLGHEIVVRGKQGYAVINPMETCDRCDDCLSGRPMLCARLQALGRTKSGGFSGVIVTSATSLVAIDYTKPELGVLCDPYAVVLRGCQKMTDGRKVMIVGDGIIAQLCLIELLSPDRDTRECVVVTKNHDRAVALRAWIEALNLNRTTTFRVCESMDDIKAGDSFQTIFETVGRGQSDTLNSAIRFIANGGKIISYGVYPVGYQAMIDIRPLLYKEATLIGSNSYTHKDLVESCRLIGERQAIFNNLIGDTYESTKIKQAIKAAMTSSEGLPRKTIISYIGCL